MIRSHEDANHSDHRRTSQGIQAEMRIRRRRHGYRRKQADWRLREGNETEETEVTKRERPRPVLLAPNGA